MIRIRRRCTVSYDPEAVCRPEDGNVCLAVTVIVRICDLIAILSEPLSEYGPVGAEQVIPIAAGRTPNANIGFIVTVEITQRRHVAQLPELQSEKGPVRAVLPVPGPLRRPEYTHVGLTVTIIVGGCRQVLGNAEHRIAKSAI